MKDVISQKAITEHMKNALPVYAFDSIDSTNQFARTLSEDCALVVADTQHSGRGRMGRRFFSPKGTGVYLSLKINVPDLYKNVPFISTLASVAVHKAINSLYCVSCGIKWVNDIYIGTKKVAGILCEAPDCDHAIIGIGVNVYPSTFPEELKSSVTYLTEHGSSVTRNMLISEITDNLISLLKALPDTSFIDYYKIHSIVIGENIVCITPEGTFTGIATGITDECALIVQSPDGIRTLSTGEVSIRFTD